MVKNVMSGKRKGKNTDDGQEASDKISRKRAEEIVGNIWDNELTDAKRKEIYKRYGKTKSPNK